MQTQPFRGTGSTPARRRFWNDLYNQVRSLDKIAGKNVTINKHFGSGTVINVGDSASRGGHGAPPPPPVPPGEGACCSGGTCFLTTPEACQGSGGTFYGLGAPCGVSTCTPGPCSAGCHKFTGCVTFSGDAVVYTDPTTHFSTHYVIGGTCCGSQLVQANGSQTFFSVGAGGDPSPGFCAFLQYYSTFDFKRYTLGAFGVASVTVDCNGGTSIQSATIIVFFPPQYLGTVFSVFPPTFPGWMVSVSETIGPC